MNKETEALGRHILVEYYDCAKEILRDITLLEQELLTAAKITGATVLNSIAHKFTPQGVSVAVIIAESHLTIHTWADHQYASVDLYTCGNLCDPWKAFEHMSTVLNTKNFSAMEMKRGIKHFLPKPDQEFDENYQDSEMTRWYHDLDSYGYGVSVQTLGDCLFREQSQFQRVEVFKTKKYGNMLLLDGKIQTTEGDEFIYHELISHIPLLTMENAKRVLIIGGGDGGTAREVMRHENLEEVVMVEIDQVVIDASKKFLPTISCALDQHPKLQLLVDDGINYVKQSKDKSFDIILVDSTDPIGPGVTLFDDDFYKNCFRILTDNGVLITQSESPTGAPNEFKDLYTKYYRVFGEDKVYCYKCPTPTYSTGLWTFSYCTKGNVHPFKNLNEEHVKQFLAKNKLQYYNADIHRAVFALPNYIKKMMNDLKPKAQ